MWPTKRSHFSFILTVKRVDIFSKRRLGVVCPTKGATRSRTGSQKATETQASMATTSLDENSAAFALNVMGSFSNRNQMEIFDKRSLSCSCILDRVLLPLSDS